LDPAHNLYVTSAGFVRKIAVNGAVTTFAGSGASLIFSGDNGAATMARLNTPTGIAVDSQGNRYLADSGNNRVRKVTPTGIISTIAGTGDGGFRGDNGPATTAQLNRPRSVAVDSLGDVFVADSANNAIRKITPAGMITSVDAQLNDPEYVVAASDGSLYVADCGNNRVVKLLASGGQITVSQLLAPSSLFLDAAGNLLASGQSQVIEVSLTGAVTTILGGLNAPRGLLRLENGDLLIAETGVNVIRRLAVSGSLSIAAGNGVPGFSGDGGSAGTAELNTPFDLALDANGAVLIADSGNNRIRILAPQISAVPSAAGISVVNAATMLPGPIASSEIITIFGSGFVPNQTQLKFDGASTTIFYVGANQINALAPANLAPNSTTEITILVNGETDADFSAATTAASPGLFTVANGTGQAAAVNQDGTRNGPANPAQRLSIVSFYATGAGLNMTDIGITIGGYRAQVFYSGPATGFPGLTQINAQIPAGFLAPGLQPVVLTAGAATSPNGVMVAIQ
jgi:uncharacterized protein (TIGR03437 family)